MKKVKQYILNSIDLSVYDDSAANPMDAAKKVVSYIMNEADYPYNRQRLKNDVNIISDHLAGLPSYINVAFTNYDILNLCVEFGILEPGYTDSQASNAINNWFNLIANNLLQISNGYHIKGLKYS